MSFAVAFTVKNKTPYPVRKSVYLIHNPDGETISTVERRFLNSAIYDMYKDVDKAVDQTYYGLVDIVRKATSDYTVVPTTDERIINLFNKES